MSKPAGVDFDIQAGHDHYSDRAGKLNEYGLKGKKVYLRVAPQCPFPDQRLGNALKPRYLTVFVYNFTAIRHMNTSAMIQTSSRIHAINGHHQYLLKRFTLDFLTLKAAAENGYVPKQVLINEVLPFAKRLLSMEGLCFGKGTLIMDIVLLSRTVSKLPLSMANESMVPYRIEPQYSATRQLPTSSVTINIHFQVVIDQNEIRWLDMI
ncbi:unnamed protein product [Fraxinus pennsylvanica]|uniref:chitinase n=1 Tax=Fraxinus pennsylvanica TaxID=56036 RepID=A0AAD2DYV1_9LAMI|nr:unnamed protein product [Fraxinus pennsylvanica]